MAAKNYYMLVASLPLLPHFELAEWLPLTRRQLDQRLGMLTDEHRDQLRSAELLLKWQRQPITRTSEQFISLYDRVLPELTHPALREFVEFSMTQRTVLVALRRRRLGLPIPDADEAWGAGPCVRRIMLSWDRVDFGLGQIMPWIEDAGRLLEDGDAVELEKLMMNILWSRLSRIAERTSFGFENVVAFVFRWEILAYWLSFSADAAGERFEELILEVTHDQKKLVS